MAYRQDRLQDRLRAQRGTYNSRPRPNYERNDYYNRERRPSNDYNKNYDDSSIDAAKMRKFLTYCLLGLLIFCIFIEFELDEISDSVLPNMPKFPKLGLKLNLRSKFREGIGGEAVLGEGSDSGDSSSSSKLLRNKRNVPHIPLGFIPTHSGEYKVKLFHLSPDLIDWEFHDLTITTQCSANRLFNIKSLADRWDGPISVAVFIPGKEAGYALDFIDGLRKCWPETVGKRTSFHLAYPTDNVADVYTYGSLVYNSCDELLKIIENYGSDNYEHKIPYPHNVLRNAARNGVTTEFVLLIDVDLSPSVNLRQMFMDYAFRNGIVGSKYLPPPNDDKEDKRVFVIPTFEIKDGYQVPTNKKSLLNANADGMIRPFHNKTCWWCHAPEEHNKWLNLPDPAPKKLSSGFYANWAKSWEPFYIARRNVPLFDERFKQYGYDRIEQICELHLMGYDFVVLDKAFLIHKGWKEFTKEERKKETYRNWILFNFHFHQMLLRVHDNGKSCAPIEKWEPKGRRAIDEIANKRANLMVKTAEEVINEKREHENDPLVKTDNKL